MREIPYGRHWIDDVDIAAVTDVLKSNWLTQGPLVEKFEKKVAEYVNARYAVAFNSGTSALHGAMYAAGVRAGDEIITSPITFAATANAGVYCGARPVFVDIDNKTWCIDIEAIHEVITDRTRVIAPVDYAGYPVNIQAVMDIASDTSCIVIEDAAHAFGAIRSGSKVGSEADMTMFSFHPVKHITTGEGGIITTDNYEFAEAMRRFRSHGIVKDPVLVREYHGPWYYEMQDIGYNYRITDIQCALGISQLRRIEDFIKRRGEIANKYDKLFQNIPGLTLPPRPEISDRHAFHLYPVCITGADRGVVFQKLCSKGIFCQVHYIPVHLHPYYRDTFGYKYGDYPVAERFYGEEISLPIYPGLSDDELLFVADSVIACIGESFG